MFTLDDQKLTKLTLKDIFLRFPELKGLRESRELFHKPKHPSIAVMEKLSELAVDVENGKVYNWDGRELGYSDDNGRVHVSIATGNGKAGEYRILRRSHIIWWKAKGYWPRMTIDHEDIDCSNDRIGNLREATMQVQNANRRIKG